MQDDAGATHHPGFAPLLLVLRAAMVLVFANPQEPVGMLLGSRAFVGTGLISDGPYLCHFPVFALARIREPASHNADKLEWIALALALSVASCFIIEKPFRNRIRLPAVRGVSGDGSGAGFDGRTECGELSAKTGQAIFAS